MRHPFFATSGPLLFAHRGGSGLAPENTIAAFDRAMQCRVDGLELDVRLSRDGIPVVIHDARLERTTNLSGPVDAYSAADLARANASRDFRTVSPALEPGFADDDLGVPALTSILHRYRDVRIIIELKLNDPALAEAVLAIVRAASADERVCLGSFGGRVLRAARRLAPHVATSAAREEVRWALYRTWIRWPSARVPYAGYQVPERSGTTRVVSRRFVQTAHDAGLGVQVWTVDDPSDARRLLDWGVDGIISDRPDVLREVVRGCSAPAGADRSSVPSRLSMPSPRR